ncbi:MAG: GDSL-type esterase/lipase family protein [bacterium]
MRMKKSATILILFSLWIFQERSTAGDRIRIACVGNSITFGSRIVNREKNSYPAQLQMMLSDSFNVQNFGVSGSTLLKKSNSPYWNTPEYKRALEFNPHIVFIKLGTNDSKLQNRVHLKEFVRDYLDLVASFKSLSAKPRVILLTPIPAYRENDTVGITPGVIREEIVPLVREAAYQSGCEVINLYNLFLPFKAHLMPDSVHPSSLGATVVANRLYEAVLQKSEQNFDLVRKLGILGDTINFHGFKGTEFKYNGWLCRIVQPYVVAPGKPWIWRARFWNHEPQTEIALLERGFHLVYCDIVELFGNPEAIARWNTFYNLMQQGGLAPKVALEGLSRGGLMIYNWAAANPEKVACIYADAPVLDAKSWPAGVFNGKPSTENYIAFKKVFGISSDEEMMKFKGSPIDKAAIIARGCFPMLHICGDADVVVPIEENTDPFEKAILQHGGSITVIRKKGVDHHPHSLEDPTPIVDFILRATNLKINFASIPAPGSEFRPAAGWTEGADWWANTQDIENCCAESGGLDILFIGNSITQGLGGNRKTVTHKLGKITLDEVFPGMKCESAGISGDRTQHILWRVSHGNYDVANPRYVVLTIGVNNFPYDDAEEITAGIVECVKAIRLKIPKAQVILVGPFPVGITADDPWRKKYETIHAKLSAMIWDRQVQYLSLSKEFIDTNGSLNTHYVAKDGIHLLPDGYLRWMQILKERAIH